MEREKGKKERKKRKKKKKKKKWGGGLTCMVARGKEKKMG